MSFTYYFDQIQTQYIFINSIYIYKLLACQIAMEKISLLYVNYNFNEFYTFFTTFFCK